MTDIKSDDTEDQLTVIMGPDCDMWVGLNGFNLARFRNGIGGGINPHTYVALRNLELAMLRDKENQEKGINSMLEWTKAIHDLKPTFKEEAIAKVREMLSNGQPEWDVALVQISKGQSYEQYMKHIVGLGHSVQVNRATFDVIELAYKKEL